MAYGEEIERERFFTLGRDAMTIGGADGSLIDANLAMEQITGFSRSELLARPWVALLHPEDVGIMLWKWMPPNGDFQHLPSWRELGVATALSLRRHHAETLIVPMSLIRDAYRAEILGGLADAGEEVLHVFLEADAGVLRERLNARVTHPGRDWDQAARELGMTGVDQMVAAAARQPAATLMLRSDRLTPAELADGVLARAARLT